MLVEIGGLKLAAGGEWALPASKADAAEFLKRNRRGKIVDSHVVGERVLGAFESSEQGVYAGALLIGKAVPNAVIYHAINDDLMWVAAVRDGIPLADFDRVCSKSDASQIITDLLSFNPSATVVGNLPSAMQSLKDVLVGAREKDIQRFKIERQGARLIKLGAIGGGALFVLGVGTLVWQYHGQLVVETVAPDQSEAAILAENERIRQASAQYQRDVAQAVDTQASEFLSGVSAGAAFTVLDRIMTSMPLQKRGWKLEKMECDLAAKTCVGSWKKGVGALQGDLVGVAKNVTLEMGGVSVLPSEPIPVDPQLSSIVPTGVDGVLRVLSLRDRYAAYGVSLTVDPMATPNIATLPPTPNGVPALPPPEIGKFIRFSLSGGILLTRDFANQLGGAAKVQTIGLSAIDTGQPMLQVGGMIVMEGAPRGNL